MEARAQLYLDRYLNALSEVERKKYNSFSADYFCADEENANICAELIRTGKKTATCSLNIWYESGEEPLPEVGHLMVVVNWSGEPICIIEIESVERCKYNQVTPEFAYAEGEGNRTLEWWREAHWEFFSKECDELGVEPNEDMLLVLERCYLVYQ